MCVCVCEKVYKIWRRRKEDQIGCIHLVTALYLCVHCSCTRVSSCVASVNLHLSSHLCLDMNPNFAAVWSLPLTRHFPEEACGSDLL